ncbi:MAG: LysE family transporter [Microcoleus sp. SIO2G3]|nr:LysE family transporter [Microcoleus sp. SIO2G3]
MEFFLRGIILGFSIALPVGPIGILCIRRTLAQGQLAGLVSGLGAATADAIYGAIAGFGLTFISAILIGHASGLRIFGGIFLCYLGWKTLKSAPANQAAISSAIGLWGVYSSTVLLTIANPATILSFAAVFASFGLADAGSYRSAGVLVAGVFIGSALWWLLLSSGVNLLKSRLNIQGLQWLNRISGLILFAFGVIALIPWHLQL